MAFSLGGSRAQIQSSAHSRPLPCFYYATCSSRCKVCHNPCCSIKSTSWQPFGKFSFPGFVGPLLCHFVYRSAQNQSRCTGESTFQISIWSLRHFLFPLSDSDWDKRCFSSIGLEGRPGLVQGYYVVEHVHTADTHYFTCKFRGGAVQILPA